MPGTGVALDAGDMVGELREVILGVGLTAGASSLFVHPGNDAQSAARV